MLLAKPPRTFLSATILACWSGINNGSSAASSVAASLFLETAFAFTNFLSANCNHIYKKKTTFVSSGNKFPGTVDRSAQKNQLEFCVLRAMHDLYYRVVYSPSFSSPALCRAAIWQQLLYYACMFFLFTCP